MDVGVPPAIRRVASRPALPSRRSKISTSEPHSIVLLAYGFGTGVGSVPWGRRGELRTHATLPACLCDRFTHCRPSPVSEHWSVRQFKNLKWRQCPPLPARRQLQG